MISIQRLGEGDWLRFKDVRLRVLIDSPDAFGSTLERELAFSDQQWRERLHRTDVATFVATAGDAGKDVGLVTCAPYDESAGLYSMWVAPEARGSGVGGALVDAVIEWARGKGSHEILLDVGDHNEPAISLYRSKGFERTGVVGTLDPPREHITEHQRRLVLGSVK